MFDRPRNWKWMVPGALVGPLLVWWSQWEALGHAWASVPMVLMIVCGLAAAINGLLYLYDGYARSYSEVRAIQNQTPEVRMFEAARGMHPDTVQALLVHRRTIWEMNYIPQKDVVDWTFREAPSLHAGFVDFVLDHSTGRGMMSKKLLSDGSKQFDPEGLVTDREQYESLFLLLRAKLMVTEPFGNQAPQWLPPWTPELIRHRFGLDGDVGRYDDEDKAGLVQAVVRAQQRVAGGRQNVVEQLPDEVEAAKPIQQKKSADDGVALTDEEWDAIQKVRENYPTMSVEMWRKLKKQETS